MNVAPASGHVHRRAPLGRVAVSAVALALPLAFAASAAQADPPGYDVLLAGLDNPRGVAVAANGRVYVVEAGTGGDVLTVPGPEGMLHIGFSARIKSVNPRNGHSSVVASGLLSGANDDGTAEAGPGGLSASGSTVYAIMGGFPSAVPDSVTGADANAVRAQLGRLLKVTPSGSIRTVADVGTFDFDYTASSGVGVDGDAEAQDANPYGVLALPGKVLVADAGSNTITSVRTNGRMSILTDVPTNTTPTFSDSVPTCVAHAGNGRFFVGTLDGQVFNWDGHSALQPSDALTLTGDPLFTIGGCTSDGHGGLYATDQASFIFGQQGSVVHVSASGAVTTVVGDLLAPAGIALSADGHNLYVATNSILADYGQLIRIPV